MENAETILVIFLSTALFIFLALGIYLIILCIRIARHVNYLSEKAVSLADKAENVADFISKSTGPLVIGRIISQVTDAFNKGRKSRSNKEE